VQWGHMRKQVPIPGHSLPIGRQGPVSQRVACRQTGYTGHESQRFVITRD